MYVIPEAKLANAEQIAKNLVKARETWTGLTDFPGDLPTSLDEAYAIQPSSIKSWKKPLIGWKIGGIGDAHSHLGSKKLAGPIYQDNLVFDSGKRNKMLGIKGGFAAIEGEIVIKTAVDLKPGMYGTMPLQDMIASVHIGVEIAGSSILRANPIGPMCVISDSGCNAGQIVGREIKDWRDRDFSQIYESVTIDGKQVGRKAIGPFIDGPMTSFAFLIKNCSDRGFDLPAGSYITTGAISGVHDTHIGTVSKVEFEGIGSIEIELVSGAK